MLASHLYRTINDGRLSGQRCIIHRKERGASRRMGGDVQYRAQVIIRDGVSSA